MPEDDPEREGRRPDAPRRIDIPVSGMSCAGCAVNVGRGLKDVAGAIGVPESMLVELNPELRYKATPKDYSLRVPPDRAQLLITRLDTIPRYTPPKKRYAYHRVRRGETLSHIAKRYRVSVRAIANANGIVQKNFIRVGQKLKIPVR